MLPIFGPALNMIREKHPDLRVVIPVADAAADLVSLLTRDWPFPVVFASPADRFDAFAASDAAMAKSGTVTLELALADVPMVVAYRVSPATAFVVRRLISIKYASLVNLLNEREVVPEFLQENCTPERLAAGVEALLSSSKVRDAQHQGFRQMAKALGDAHPSPSERAAKVVLDIIASRNP
jgi:lipid-A-disaccharide synthase